MDGVVASVQEAKDIRKACGRDFLIVTPGVRPKAKSAEGKMDDQARTATPREAIRAGADFIVVGRPIIAAVDPAGGDAGNRGRNCRREGLGKQVQVLRV